jgi:hypothetical protein
MISTENECDEGGEAENTSFALLRDAPVGPRAAIVQFALSASLRTRPAKERNTATVQGWNWMESTKVDRSTQARGRQRRARVQRSH